HSSLVKGAMNAVRVCKFCNGVKKTPKFLLFSIAKGEPSAQWIFSAAIVIDGIIYNLKIGGAILFSRALTRWGTGGFF
ncbi:MAG: hypothetical protein ACK559_16860, partial [bacterium]